MKIEIMEKRVVEAYKREHGVTLQKLATRYHKCLSTISDILKRNGVVPVSSKRIPTEDYSKIIKQIHNGESYVSIGHSYNISSQAISYFARRRNICKTPKIEILSKCSKSIIEMYKKGFSIERIGKFYSSPRWIIRKILIDNNIEIGQFRNVNTWHLRKCPALAQMMGEKYKNGISGLKLAKEYGVEPRIIYDVLGDLNIKTRNNHWNYKNPIISPEDHSKIFAEYIEGSSPTQLAKKYGVGNSYISNLVSKLKIKAGCNHYHQRPGLDTLKIIPLKDVIIHKFKNGTSSGKLAKEYNVSSYTICNLLNRNNIYRKTIRR